MAGDFNTWSHKRLNLVRELTSSLDLREVTDFPSGRTTGDRGWDGWDKMLGVNDSLPLDRVFFSGYVLISARVLDHESSDHRPILVTLELLQ